MSRKGEESDEEVYLSDPSDDDSSSVDGYEFTSDEQARGGHASAPAEMDWTLHDQEAARAASGALNPRQPAKAEEPREVATTSLTDKKAMNPNAAPWVPPSSKPSSSQAPKQEPPSNGGGQGQAADPTPGNPPAAVEDSTTPAAAAVNKNGHKGSSESPVDVSQIMERVIAANTPPSSDNTPHVSEEPIPTPTQDAYAEPPPLPAAPAATPTPAPVTQDSLAALDDLEPLPSAEELDSPSQAKQSTTQQEESKDVPAEQVTPTAAEVSPAVVSAELPKTEAAAPPPSSGDAKGTTAEQVTTTTAGEVSPAVASAELPKTEAAAPPPALGGIEGATTGQGTPSTAGETTPAVASAELPKTEAAAPPPKVEEDEGESSESGDSGYASDSGSAPHDVGTVNGESEPVAADETPAETTIEAGPSSQVAEPQRPAAMPSLPERKKKGAAMPSLPPRPTRRQDQADSSGGITPSSDGTTSTQPQQPPTSSPAPSTTTPPAPTPPAPAVPAQAAAGGEVAQRQANPVLVQRAPATAPAEEESPDMQQKRAQLKDLRVNMQRCAKRLGLTEHALIRQVKYRLEHAERVRLGRTSGVEEIPALADRLEAENPQEELLEITAMVIGLTGSGKSATINGLLGYDAVSADAFDGTKTITTVSGAAFGLRIKLVDTPGLHAAGGSHRENGKLIEKINKARAKCKPDLIIYCDRMDILPTDGSHIPLIRQITEVMGSEMWFNTLALMTHATAEGPCNPREGPLPYSHFAPLRQQIFQRTLQQAIGDQRMNSPTAFVENSATCPKNGEGEAVLPDGLAWRKFVLLYMAVMKTLTRADECMEVGQPDIRRGGAQSAAMSQLQMMLMQQRGGGNKLPPLPFLVTNMIKHAGPKQYPEVERDIKRPDEIKSIKNFTNRRREARKRINYLKAKHIEKRLMGIPNSGYEAEEDPTEEPSMAPALPPTFDVDDTSHLYRAYEPNPNSPGWITRMRLEQNVVDHTDGVESLTTERSFVKRTGDQHLGGVPCQVHAIIEKGKTSQMFQGGAEASIYQNWRTIHTGRAQLLTMSGNDVLYISQLDTQLLATKDNRLTLGGLVSLLGEDGLKPAKDRVALGMKLEDEMELPVIKWKDYRHSAKAGLGQASVSFKGRKEKARGMNGEYTLIAGKKEEHQLVASYSQMTYRGNSQKQYGLSAALPLSAETTASPKLQLQSGGQGSFSLSLTSHDHPSIGLTALIPLAKALWDNFRSRGAGAEY